MKIDLTRGRPLRCSKCGSINASRPINNPDIVAKCDDCGHVKLSAGALMRRKTERDYPDFAKAWQSKDTESDVTF